MLENTEGKMKKGQSRETGNIRVLKTNKNKTKTQHNMCWASLYANKHISHETQSVKTYNWTNKQKYADEHHEPYQKKNSKTKQLKTTGGEQFFASYKTPVVLLIYTVKFNNIYIRLL